MSTSSTVDLSTCNLLFVDDEQNILSSLRRLFRPLGYTIHVANGGREGLEVLEREKIDLVISDMRMPEMDGARFLAEVASRRPEVIRLLLTGYADMSSTIDAINKGGIYRYISKPWEDNDIRLTVQHALEQNYLQAERARLEELTQAQNEELKSLNATLEDKVLARTEEIRQTALFLELALEELKRSYQQAIPVFANLIELREGDQSGHSRRVAERARQVAQAMGMDEERVQDVYFAALLHDVGKFGLPDELVQRPYAALSLEQRRRMAKHPVLGEAALLALEPLQPAACLVRAHHERYDGKGYPDALAGEAIPLGARVLAVVNDYDALQLGTLVEGSLTPDEAREFITRNSGSWYDPAVVDVFLEVLDRLPQDGPVELRVMSGDLLPGMRLSRDLADPDGMLLLAAGHVLNERLIERIRRYERDQKRGFTVYVQSPEEDGQAPVAQIHG